MGKKKMTVDQEARAQISTHEKVCAERYAHLGTQLNSLNGQHVTVHERLNAMSNRMWSAAVGTLLAAVSSVGALGLILFNMLGRGGH